MLKAYLLEPLSFCSRQVGPRCDNSHKRIRDQFEAACTCVQYGIRCESLALRIEVEGQGRNSSRCIGSLSGFLEVVGCCSCWAMIDGKLKCFWLGDQSSKDSSWEPQKLSDAVEWSRDDANRNDSIDRRLNQGLCLSRYVSGQSE